MLQARTNTDRTLHLGASPGNLFDDTGARPDSTRLMEALRTRVDKLQWDINRLQAENRRLREENPDVSRTVALEAELELSKGEVARLMERAEMCERQLEARAAATTVEAGVSGETELAEALGRLQTVTEQLEAERQITSDLRVSLRELKEREGELVEGLEARDEAMQKCYEEEERGKEARELQYYRALEAVREKWEAREQRALDELDRLRKDKGGWGGVDDITLSGRLREAPSEQQSLREELSKYMGLVTEYESQLEECQLEKEELKAELGLAHAKVRRLERCGSKPAGVTEEDCRDDIGADSPSSRLDVRAPVFESRTTGQCPVTLIPASVVPPTLTSRASVPSSLPEAVTSTSTTHGIPCASEAQTLMGLHPVSSVLCSPAVSTPVTGVNSPASSIPLVPSHLEAGHLSTSGITTTPGGGVATSVVMSEEVPRVASFVPPVTSGFGFPYPMVPPNLPQIANFYGGDQRDGETFEEWIDQFESVARVAGWNKHFKLVHLTAALKGAAKSFYRSCTPAQRSDYEPLVSALKQRFTPVKLTAVQTQMFHSRRQGGNESVDDFAQELRRLHSRAYSTATSASSEAEKVGQIVLVNQFVSGLRSELQAKVVGVEGNMDEMVAKARFEETKLRELTGKNSVSIPKKTLPQRGPTGGSLGRQQSQGQAPVTTTTT